MSGQSGLCQPHRGLEVSDRVGGQRTRPGDAVGMRRIGRAAGPFEKVLAGTPNACLVPGYYEGEDMLMSKHWIVWVRLYGLLEVVGGPLPLPLAD